MSEPDPLRARLLALQADALARLAEGKGIDTGMLELVAHCGAALAALDAEAAAALAPECDARAVVLDDNVTITLAVFSADRQAAAATLNPATAIYIASRLIAAALPRLR